MKISRALGLAPALLLLAALPACGQGSPTPPPPERTSAPAATPAAVNGNQAAAQGGIALPANALVAEVVRVVDGDTIDIQGVRVRYNGVDALESNQVCTRTDGIQVLCGAAARARMAELVAGATVVCIPDGSVTHGRTVADCQAYRAGQRPVALSAELVRSGFAFDCPRYSRGRFAADEVAARRMGAGAWGTRFDYPWVHRGSANACGGPR